MPVKPSDEEVFVRCFVSLITSKENIESLREPKSIAQIVTGSPGKVFRLMIDIEYNQLGGPTPGLCSHNVMIEPVRQGANDPKGGDEAA